MSFRLLLQPAMAMIFAIRDGLKDAREGRPAYFYSLFTDPANRRSRLRGAFKAVSRVFALAIIMDLFYQVIVLRWFYPLQALMVAFILAFLPYILLRGPANRIARSLKRQPGAPGRRLGRA
jgi:Flp pilus assembly protein TadB